MMLLHGTFKLEQFGKLLHTACSGNSRQDCHQVKGVEVEAGMGAHYQNWTEERETALRG